MPSIENLEVADAEQRSAKEGYLGCCGKCCLFFSLMCLALLLALYATLKQGNYRALGLEKDDLHDSKDHTLVVIYMYVVTLILSVGCIVGSRMNGSQRGPAQLQSWDGVSPTSSEQR